MESSSIYSSIDLNAFFPAYTSFAEIDLQQLRKNAQTLIHLARPATLIAVVKANAYGHGANKIASVLESEGVSQFMVATLNEALNLRCSGIEAPILVASPPHQRNFPLFREHGLHASIVSSINAERVLAEAVDAAPLHIHLKVDTGMGRLGMTESQARRLIPLLREHPAIHLESLWTHLATATHFDTRFATEQIQRIRSLHTEYADQIPFFHAANGGALLNLPELAGQLPNEKIRVGGAMLGLSPLQNKIQTAGLSPILTLKSRILQIKTVNEGDTLSYGREWTAPEKRRIATVGIGYGDGYPSNFDMAPTVFIGGREYPVAGRVCMDMLMVDLGRPDSINASIRENDEVILFGPSFPNLYRLSELSAKKAYEICCNLSPRVVRMYR